MATEVTDTIVIDKLTKRYGNSEHIALKELSLRVQRGEVYGFLGPNGAGKSTTIRLLMNFLQPTSGGATILGMDIVRDSVKLKHKVGYLSGDFELYPKFTGYQALDYLAEVQGAKNVQYTVQLADRFKANLNVPVRDLSKGNRQKLGIIQAFMHKPEVLILDEPTGGLDPLMQEEFYKLLRETSKRGATVFVSSHNLGEVQKMCDRVGIVRDGLLVSEQSIDELARQAAHTFMVTFDDRAPVAALKVIDGVQNVNTISEKAVSLQVNGPIQPLLKFLATQKVARLATHELNLEEEFMRFYQTAEVES